MRLPYDGADPWPGLVLQLLGSALVMVSALLAFWPRGAGGGRGYPFLALAALLVLAAAPVVSLGGTRPLLLGAGLTLLTVCFLWLERLPLRPGLGVAALIGLALAGALPLAAAADRGEPWFDYQAFAEGLAPKDPVRFSWEHGDYGPVTWSAVRAPRWCACKAARPAYWKVRTLDDFDGRGWDSGGFDRESDDPFLDLPPQWETQSRFEDTIEVSVQRMRGTDVLGAGTTLDVTDATRPVTRGVAPGQWHVGERAAHGRLLPRARVRPAAVAAAARGRAGVADRPSSRTTSGPRPPARSRRRHELALAARPTCRGQRASTARPPGSATIELPARSGARAWARSRTTGQLRRGGRRRGRARFSDLARTWGSRSSCRPGSATPYEYLAGGQRVPAPAASPTPRSRPRRRRGVTPLESFLFDTKAGYCQHFSAAMALLLRMGGVPARVATGLLAGRLLEAQAGLDRARHRRALVGRGLVRRLRLGDRRPDAGARPRRARRSPRSRPPAAGEQPPDDGAITNQGGQGGSGPADRAGGGRARGALRPPPRGRTAPGRPRRPRRAAAAAACRCGCVAAARAWLRSAGGAACVRCARAGAGPDDPLDRAIIELETALRRSGRAPVGGMTLRQLEQRLGLSEEAAGYLRAVSAGRYAARAPVRRRTPSAGRCGGSSRSGSAVRAGRLRTFWALPPRPR